MIVVGIPAYDGRLLCETARSLLNEQAAAVALGIDLEIRFLPGSSLIHVGRDALAKDFLDSGADRLVFIDSDVAWEPGDLLKLATRPEDVVGGAYRYKDATEGYPVGWLPEPELWANEAGLIEVGALPGGFLAISRTVFEKLRNAYPGRAYTFHGRELYGYFHCPPGAGEDGTFCQEWRAIGGKVMLDPEITLTHVGGNPKYTGRIGDWLKSGAAHVL